MSDLEKLKLVKPPNLPWEGPFPYDCLNELLRNANHPGIGPQSSVVDVADAEFTLMTEGVDNYQEAYGELSDLQQRFFLDFCHYPLRLDDQQDAQRPEGLPVSMEALAKLADSPPRVPWPPLGDPVSPPTPAPVPPLSPGPLDVAPHPPFLLLQEEQP